MLVSAKHQHESAIGVHMSPPSWVSLPSHASRLLQSPSWSSLSHTANSHWLSILHMIMYMFPCWAECTCNLFYHLPLRTYLLFLFFYPHLNKFKCRSVRNKVKPSSHLSWDNHCHNHRCIKAILCKCVSACILWPILLSRKPEIFSSQYLWGIIIIIYYCTVLP